VSLAVVVGAGDNSRGVRLAAATDGLRSARVLSGFLHGLLMFFSLIGSLFTDVRIYAFPNSGVWYDVGFFLGAAALLGGGNRAA
jgi:hypothetical protein